MKFPPLSTRAAYSVRGGGEQFARFRQQGAVVLLRMCLCVLREIRPVFREAGMETFELRAEVGRVVRYLFLVAEDAVTEVYRLAEV